MPRDISVVIEWENVLLAEMARCVEMLVQLRRQILSSRRAIEVLVVFNPGQVGREVVEEAVAHYLAPTGDDVVACRILAGAGLHYYQLKNLGAGQAEGEVVVFVDSDVIPEADWLAALTEPFWARPGIEVVAGHTHLDHRDLMGRAFALGWFFPLPAADAPLAPGGRHFFANNVAFRRAVITAHPFPDMADGMTRGACVQLAGTLVDLGIDIWRQPAARTSHPAPNGLAHFVARGLAQGRDWALAREEDGSPAWRIGLHAPRRVFSRTWRMLRRALRHHRTVGLPAWQIPLAVAIMAVFHLEECLGAWAYVLAPARARRWWRI